MARKCLTFIFTTILIISLVSIAGCSSDDNTTTPTTISEIKTTTPTTTSITQITSAEPTTSSTTHKTPATFPTQPVTTMPSMIPNPIYPCSTGSVDKQPEFFWESVTGADSYEFQLSSSKSFYSTVVSSTLTSTNYFYSSATLDYATQYYWRVRSINADGAKSDWCETQCFTVCEDC